MATRLHHEQPDERSLVAALRRALAAGGTGALVEQLSRLARDSESGRTDKAARLELRHFHHRAELLRAAGGVLTTSDAAARLGVHPVTALRHARTRRLLAIHEGGRWFFPACQFAAGAALPHLDELLAALPEDFDPWWALDVLLAPSSTLEGLSPLEAARRGEPHLSRAIDELRGYGADGFG